MVIIAFRLLAGLAKSSSMHDRSQKKFLLHLPLFFTDLAISFDEFTISRRKVKSL